MSMSTLDVTWGITVRSLKLIPRFPSTFVPSLIMPIMFVVAFSGAFAGLTGLPGFPVDQMIDWILPMTVLQGCAFAGITTGMAVARDFENGFFDRFTMSPAPRGALVAGPLLASVLRAVFPLVLLPIIGLAMGADFKEGVYTLWPLIVAGLGVALIAGMWAVGLALRARSSQAAPMMQMPVFLGFFLSTAQMPLELLTGWVKAVARVNPMTNILELGRQGFVGDISWTTTWPGLISLLGVWLVLGLFVYRGIQKVVH